jgi:hypothetical protein
MVAAAMTLETVTLCHCVHYAIIKCPSTGKDKRKSFPRQAVTTVARGLSESRKSCHLEREDPSYYVIAFAKARKGSWPHSVQNTIRSSRK